MLLLNLALNCSSLKVFLEHYVAHENMLKKPIWVFVLQNKELHLQTAVTVARLETQVSPGMPRDEGAKTVWKTAHASVTSPHCLERGSFVIPVTKSGSCCGVAGAAEVHERGIWSPLPLPQSTFTTVFHFLPQALLQCHLPSQPLRT